MLLEKQTTNESTGIYALNKFFVEKYGFSKELVRTLVVKYPFILSKKVKHLQSVFEALEKEAGISPEQSIRLIFECPKLLSIDLDEKMSKTFYLFDLYYGFTKEEVCKDIF